MTRRFLSVGKINLYKEALVNFCFISEIMKNQILLLSAFITACFVKNTDAATSCEKCISVCNITPTDATGCISKCRSTFADCSATSDGMDLTTPFLLAGGVLGLVNGFIVYNF